MTSTASHQLVFSKDCSHVEYLFHQQARLDPFDVRPR